MSANDRQHGGSHYQTKGMQHWDFTWENNYNQFEYCMSKYLLRCYKKNGDEDIEKAIHHGEKYIEMITGPIFPRKLRNVVQMDRFLDHHEVTLEQREILTLIHLGNIGRAVKAMKDMLEDLPRTYVNPDL